MHISCLYCASGNPRSLLPSCATRALLLDICITYALSRPLLLASFVQLAPSSLSSCTSCACAALQGPPFPCSSHATCALLLREPAHFLFLLLSSLGTSRVRLYNFCALLLHGCAPCPLRSSLLCYSFFLVLASYFSYFFFPNLIHLSPVYHASSDCPGSPWDTGLYVGHR